jgi:hypothetical protein
LRIVAKDKIEKDDFIKFLLSVRKNFTFILTPYTNYIHPFLEGTDAPEVNTPAGRFIIVLEAILQQLITGIV